MDVDLDQLAYDIVDLDQLAYDIADLLDRNGYPIDVAASHIQPELAAFINRITANAAADNA